MLTSLSKPVLILIINAPFWSGHPSLKWFFHALPASWVHAVIALGVSLALFELITWRQRRSARPKIILTLR